MNRDNTAEHDENMRWVSMRIHDSNLLNHQG